MDYIGKKNKKAHAKKNIEENIILSGEQEERIPETVELIRRDGNCKTCPWFKILVSVVLIGILIVGIVFLGYFIKSRTGAVARSSTETLDGSLSSQKVINPNPSSKPIPNSGPNSNVDVSAYHLHLVTGVKDIRQCRKEKSSSTDLRKTFPDIDYAMLGYNIIEGYPDSNGHDPGFTYPIFMADYSNHRLTSDCRYSIPKGFVIIPDVSCVTSFTSTIMRNTLEMHNSFEVSVQASAGFKGFSFSASSSYKTSFSQVSSGERVFVTSSAKCNYYFTEIDTTQPPPLNPGFLRWAKILERNTTSNKTLIEFVKYYGTHFPIAIVFGARYIRKHSMTTKEFKTASSRKFSVGVQASYAGKFSAGGGFNMDSEQRRAAIDFSKNVETTSVSVGAAPPSNGDAQFWAATVKENPVPTSYKLKPIADLFTSVFMTGTGINYTLIRKKLKGIEKKYCQHLFSEGIVNTCDDDVAIGLRIPKHQLYGATNPHALIVSEPACMSKCFDDEFCTAVSYFPNSRVCKFHNGKTTLQRQSTKAKAFIFPSRIRIVNEDLEVKKLEILDKARPIQGDESVNDKNACRDACIRDAACDIFSFAPNLRRTSKCRLYASKAVKHLEFSSSILDITTYFISRD